jgi:hypothetical protein
MPRKRKTFEPCPEELIDEPGVAEPLTEAPPAKKQRVSKVKTTKPVTPKVPKATKARKAPKSDPIDIPERKPNAWLAHVAKVRAKHPDKTYKEVLSLAKPLYKKPK